MKFNPIASVLAASLLWSGMALAAEINVLSAGAIEPGLRAAVDAFSKETGNQVKIAFATAPAIRQRVSGGERADVVIAPPAVIEELAKAGKLDAQGRAQIGRVGAGVAVRDDAPVPDVSTTEALKRSVLDAESLVYNQASTGIYIERMFQKLGIADDLKARTKRYPDANAVMQHLIKGAGKEIGFAPITEILLYKDKGLKLVGPLPADVQNYTSYVAAPHSGATNASGVKTLLEFLQKPESKRIFASKGIE